MSLPKFNPRTAVLLLMILMIGALRVLFIYDDTISPLSNFSPLGAMALFAGTYFNSRWKSFSFPLLTLFLSDVFLSLTVFRELSNGILYAGWYWVYGAFALMTIAGRLLIKKVTVASIFTTAIVSVCIHWLVSDIGVWHGSSIYAQNLGGYIACLVAAIPYELKLLAGTFIYGAILFGSFEWMQKRYSVLRTA